MITLVLFILGGLQLVLIFKIWTMSNDTAAIKGILNIKNRLNFLHNLPPKCVDNFGNVYFVKGIFEDKILCEQIENSGNVIAVKESEIRFIED